MADDKESGGVWRTVCGRRIFIRKGQSLTDAMRESGKFKKSDIDSAKSESAKSAPKSDTPTKYGGEKLKRFFCGCKKRKENCPRRKSVARNGAHARRTRPRLSRRKVTYHKRR